MGCEGEPPTEILGQIHIDGMLLQCEDQSETLEDYVQEIRESLGDVPTKEVKEWLECDRGVDVSEVMSDEATLEYVKTNCR